MRKIFGDFKKKAYFCRKILKEAFMDKTISSRFNELIERKVGLPISSIKRMSSDEIIRHIEKSNHVSLKLGETSDGMSYRGNMLLSMGQVVSDIDREFNKAFGHVRR